MGVASHVSSIRVSACNLPSRCEKITSNKLLASKDKKASEWSRVSRAQAVRALSPGCLP